MTRTRIKVCGITSVEQALAAAEAGADAIGLMFAPKSPRRIDIETAIEIIEVLPPFVTPVGVFQLRTGNEPELAEWWEEWCQLHGGEDESLIEHVAEEHRIIRGFHFDAAHVRRWEHCTDIEALLIDGSAGGKGEAFDHTALASMMDEITRPVILAGGLTPQNVGEAIRAVRPYGVDVSSGVESSPGVKEPDLIRHFCDAVREADAAVD
jgi:phosphoribosylanthranilate isomerase